MVELRTRVHIRQADEYDASTLAKLRVASLLEQDLLAPADVPAFERRAVGEFWTLLRSERAAAWLLDVDDRPRGCVCLVFWERLPYPGTSLHAELAGVYVAPEARRQGYAAELITEAIATARARGARRILLQPNPKTRDLYRRFGFAESGQLRL